MAGRRDPRDEHAVGVVDEVIARERVDEVTVAEAVRGRDRDQLAVAGRRGSIPSACDQRVTIRRVQRRGHEDRRVVAGTRRVDERVDRVVVAREEPADEELGIGRRHDGIVRVRADISLTPR